MFGFTYSRDDSGKKDEVRAETWMESNSVKFGVAFILTTQVTMAQHRSSFVTYFKIIMNLKTCSHGLLTR